MQYLKLAKKLKSADELENLLQNAQKQKNCFKELQNAANNLIR